MRLRGRNSRFADPLTRQQEQLSPIEGGWPILDPTTEWDRVGKGVVDRNHNDIRAGNIVNGLGLHSRLFEKVEAPRARIKGVRYAQILQGTAEDLQHVGAARGIRIKDRDDHPPGVHRLHWHRCTKVEKLNPQTQVSLQVT